MNKIRLVIPNLLIRDKKMRKKILHLHVKAEYWDDVKNEIKGEEYRLYNSYWRKRLNKEFDEIWYYKGYPKRNDKTKILKFIYRGKYRRIILHKHFGETPVVVYAIPLNTLLNNKTKDVIK